MINKNKLEILKGYCRSYVICTLTSDKYLSSDSKYSASVQDSILDQLFPNLNEFKKLMNLIIRSKVVTEELSK